MANFDISRCKYITTSKNPTKYYLDTMKKFLAHAVEPNQLESEYKALVDDLTHKLQGDSINSIKVLHKVCYYSFAQMWIDACLDTPRLPGKPFALEYIATDNNGDEFIPPLGFYNKMSNAVKSVIYDPAIQTLLSKPDSFGNYPVIDLEEFGRRINKAINSYYAQAERTDERLLRSRIPTKALHNEVEQVFADFRKQMFSVIHNYNPKQNYDF